MTNENYDGLIYAGSQCKFNGNPRLSGQILCKDSPNPPGSVNYTTESMISGNPEIRYGCGGSLKGARYYLAWYEQL